jgi:GTP-binding protein LepA
MELEIERGVTIKLKAVRMPCRLFGKRYLLNMIDTPGHVDFSYEVSRSLASCEGALLLVDATQGPQAQTIAHLEKAQSLGLAILGVVNKIDSPLASASEAEKEIRALGVGGEIHKISALEGRGTRELLESVVTRIPPPSGREEPLRALVFDSTYDEHLGVVAYVRVFDGSLGGGSLRKGERVRFLGTGEEVIPKEFGYLSPGREKTSSLKRGEIGYLATGLKDPQAVRVGDTLVLSSQLAKRRVSKLPGYRAPSSFVFASFFPKSADFGVLKEALNKLRLEEPALTVEEIASPALGRGYKIGFLGTFHLEIVKERLEREFGVSLVATKPTVAFKRLEKEPWVKLAVVTPPDYLSSVTKLVNKARGKVSGVKSFRKKVTLLAEVPLMEFVKGFYDQLKSVSSGYASLDWSFLEYRPANLANLEIVIHGEVVAGLSEIVLKEQAQLVGRERVRKLKKVLPRQQFSYAIQAKVGGKILARGDVPALRKDVTSPLYGGDVTRKRKLLARQREGKKQLAKRGRVPVPPEAFLI